MEQIPVYELHIKPTYTVYMPQRSRSVRLPSAAQLKNMENLQLAPNRVKSAGTGEVRKNQLSKKAVRRLTNSVNWLVASARSKKVFERATNKRFSFKINFVTLTVPTENQTFSDHFFKSVLLHNFINTCRSKFGLQNYVWKVEAQKNGTIHAHFTTDTFIHWKDLRNVWNRILLKNGLLEEYREKHQNMSFDQYVKLYNPEGKRDESKMLAAYKFGVSTNWEQPNSTDVHAVSKVKNISAYLAKYMSKNEDDRREIKGRLWGCSVHLSETNKLIVEICGDEGQSTVAPLYDERIKLKEIEVVNKKTGSVFTAGHLFLYKMQDWGEILNGELLRRYNEHRFKIRNTVNIFSNARIEVETYKQPEIIEIIPTGRGHSSQLKQVSF